MVGVEPPGEDRLPPGPGRDLVLALHDLYRGAGRPGLRKIANAIKEDSTLPDTVSHEAVGAILRGEGLPRWSKLVCVVRQLCAWNHLRPDPDGQVARFLRLWEVAGTQASSVPGSAGNVPLAQDHIPRQPSIIPPSPRALEAHGSGPGSRQGAQKDGLRIRPKMIRQVLQSHIVPFFDSMLEVDPRDDAKANARRRVDEEIDYILSRLRAVLAMRFGLEPVSLDNKGNIGFPLGSIRASREEDLNEYESHIWCEVTIEIDSGEVSLLQELRNDQVLKYTKSKSVSFPYEGSLSLDDLAKDALSRGVRIKRFGRSELAFEDFDGSGTEVTIITSAKAVEIRFLSFDFGELDLSSALAPVFNYLKIGDHLKF